MSADSDQSLTAWIQKRNSSDKAVREEAARKIVEKYDTELLAFIEARLAPEIRRKVGAEDLLISAFDSVLRRKNEFPSRNAMFAYLKQVALHKVINLREYYHRQERDVRLEVQDDGQRFDDSGSSHRLLDAGHKPPYFNAENKRAYHRDVQMDSAQADCADSFFDDGTVNQMVYGASPDEASLMFDLVDSLQDFDRRENECLQKIVSLSIQGFGTNEIAAQLKVVKRTIERKKELIAVLWHECKAVIIRIKEQAAASRDIPLTILCTDVASSILRRTGAEGYHLYREFAGAPLHLFKPNELVYPRVAEGDILVASRC